MSISDYQGLDALCESCGIALDYYDIRGTRHEPSLEFKLALLKALQFPVESDDDIGRNAERLAARQWQSPLPAVIVHRQSDQPVRLTLTLGMAQLDKALAWELCEESG